jgi:DNA-directed RNA polymerase subunit alpha
MGAPSHAADPSAILIEELELGVDAYNVFKHAGLHVVDDLTRLSAEELAALPSVDHKVLDEIVNALAAAGLSLT